MSLLLFGLTLLMQKGFDNLLVLWQDDVEMVVYVQGQATEAQRGVIEESLSAQQGSVIESFDYCDKECALDVARTVLAGKPDLLSNLTEDQIPTFYRVIPTDDAGARRAPRVARRPRQPAQRVHGRPRRGPGGADLQAEELLRPVLVDRLSSRCCSPRCC